MHTSRAYFLNVCSTAFEFFILFLPFFSVGERVLGRWSNNLYYAGKVEDVSSFWYTILFDDGDKITHSIGDNSAVIDDKCPDEMKAGQHVVGRWKGGHKYYIGFVKEITSSGKFSVRFDDNNEDLYKKCSLRVFPEHIYVHESKTFLFRLHVAFLISGLKNTTWVYRINRIPPGGSLFL